MRHADISEVMNTYTSITHAALDNHRRRPCSCHCAHRLLALLKRPYHRTVEQQPLPGVVVVLVGGGSGVGAMEGTGEGLARVGRVGRRVAEAVSPAASSVGSRRRERWQGG